MQTSELAQQVKALMSNHDDLTLVPRVHMVEERTDSYKLSSELHMRATVCTHVCMHMLSLSLTHTQ